MKKEARKKSCWVLQGLTADGPDRKNKQKLQLFGQLVGSWDIKGRWFQPDGTVREGKGELHSAWILDGLATQDVWISHKSGRKIPVGTTLRFYDASIDKWHCTWISPRLKSIRTFVADN